MSKIMVLVAGQWSRAGGLEIVTQDIAHTFAGLGWSVTVVDMKGTGRSERLPSGILVKRFCLPDNRLARGIWHRGLKYCMAARYMQKQFKSKQALLIYGHIRTLPLDRMLSRELFASRWAWSHGVEVWGEHAAKWKPWLDGLDLVVSVSEYTARHLRQAGVVPNVTVIHNFVDTDRFTPTKNPRHIRPNEILICSRLSGEIRNKGHDILFRALPLAERQLGRPLSIRVVGGGEGKSILAEQARSLGIEDRVIFTGRISDDELVDTYQHCGVFAMPSRIEYRERTRDWTGEGFGLVYVEAALCGRPVVASSDGGAPETLLDGQTGIVADPRDPEAFAKAIASIIADPERADEMGRAGRQFALERFSRAAFSSAVAKCIEASST